MKRTFVLLPAALIVNTGIGILNFSLVFYMRDVFNSTSAQIGWFSSLWAFSYLFGCFSLHKLSRSIGAHRSIAVASFVMAIAVAFMIISKSLVLMYVLYSLFGLITALFWPPLMGWLSEGLEGPALNRVIGHFNLSWSTGLVLSPYLGGLLLESNLRYPFRFVIFLDGILFIVLVIIPILFPSIIPHKESSRKELIDIDSSTPLRFVTWLGNFTGYLMLGILIFVFPIYARETLKFTESSIGLLFLFRALFSTFIFVLAGKISFWHFNKAIMIGMQLLMIIFALLVPYANSWIEFLITLSLFGIIFAVQYSSSIFHGVSGSIHREKRMAIHESVLTIGIITGAIGGGEIYQHWTMNTVFLSAAAAATIILIFQIIIMMALAKK